MRNANSIDLDYLENSVSVVTFLGASNVILASLFQNFRISIPNLKNLEKTLETLQKPSKLPSAVFLWKLFAKPQTSPIIPFQPKKSENSRRNSGGNFWKLRITLTNLQDQVWPKLTSEAWRTEDSRPLPGLAYQKQNSKNPYSILKTTDRFKILQDQGKAWSTCKVWSPSRCQTSIWTHISNKSSKKPTDTFQILPDQAIPRSTSELWRHSDGSRPSPELTYQRKAQRTL